MTRLRHVDVGGCYLRGLGVHKAKGEGYPQMVYLESFSSPFISSTEVLVDLLQRSPSLRKLSFDYDFGKWGFQFPKHSKLESLNVSSVGEPFLRSLDFLSTLKKLTLSDCFIPWKYLPAISKIPRLEVLKLLDYAFVGVWDMEDTDFPKLKFLKLQKLNMDEWIAYRESFPILEVLIVNKCFKLNAIPACFGEMPTMKRIEVFESVGAATSVVEIHDAQKDFRNEDLEVIVSAPSRKQNYLLLPCDDDGFCYEDDEQEEGFGIEINHTEGLFSKKVFVLLGHFSGLMDNEVKGILLGVWMTLFVVFSGRKFFQPIKDEIGDKSVFMFNALLEAEKEAVIEKLKHQIKTSDS